MAKSYFYDENISDWRELVKGEQGEQGPVGPVGPEGPQGIRGPVGTLELIGGDNPAITVDTSVGTRVFVGDTMIYGDTGWVAVESDFLSSGTITFRRIGNTVYAHLGSGWSQITLNSVSPAPELIVPSGFKPGGNEFIPLRLNNSKEIVGSLSIQYNGWVQPRMLSTFTNTETVLQGNTTVWTTSDPWPTTLSGA